MLKEVVGTIEEGVFFATVSVKIQIKKNLSFLLKSGHKNFKLAALRV
jgi:hypothetical protein